MYQVPLRELPLSHHLSVLLTFSTYTKNVPRVLSYHFIGGEFLLSIDYQSPLSERINVRVGANQRRCSVALCNNSRCLPRPALAKYIYSVITSRQGDSWRIFWLTSWRERASEWQHVPRQQSGGAKRFTTYHGILRCRTPCAESAVSKIGRAVEILRGGMYSGKRKLVSRGRCRAESISLLFY